MLIKQNLPTQGPEPFIASVYEITNLRESEIDSALSSLSIYGCAILSASVNSCTPEQDLLSLSHMFGEVIAHPLSQNAIVTITPVEGAIYDGLTTQAQGLHTDGSFDSSPPPIVALQCEVAAEQGGVSQLVQAEQVYRYLAQEDIPGWIHLFDPDAIEISTVGDNKRALQPIFRWQNQRLHMVFKSSAMRVTVTPKPEVELAYQAIQRYISDPKNQMQFLLQEGQILLMDNGRILHARTAFATAAGKARRMNRLWFDGCSPYSQAMDLGFLPYPQPSHQQNVPSPLAQIA